MTEEEEKMIDAMSVHELVAFCQFESPRKLTEFFRLKNKMSKEELAARVKYGMRLSREEIKAQGSGTLDDQARYWCKVRPEVFCDLSKTDLMKMCASE